MDTRDAILLHYHEVGLKGRNRKLFERALMDNVARATSDLGELHPRRLPGRVVIDLPHGTDIQAVAERVERVYGVANLGIARSTRFDFDAVCTLADEAMAGDYDTFAVRARSSHSDIPMSPQQINEKLGAWLLERHGKRVNLSKPDRTCYVEVVSNIAYVYADRREGPGGLPVGTGGRVAVLLSAGFDSPVAAARLMQRGASPIMVHFHSQPFTDGSSVRHAREMTQVLARSGYEIDLHLVPLAPSQQQIVASCPEGLRTILYRRMMMRIACAIAEREGAKALVTGDSLGQVASQTIENLTAVEAASTLPVLRPLIGSDKVEIIDRSRAIGVHDIASAPCQEACVLFEPKNPATKARVVDLERAERGLDLDALVAEAVASTEVETIRFPA